MGSEKVLENFSRGSWKVMVKSWIFLSVEEWEPCLYRPRTRLYLKSDMIGVDEVVFGADDAGLRVAKFTNIRVEYLNVETSDEVVTDSLLDFVRSRLTQKKTHRGDLFSCRWRI